MPPSPAVPARVRRALVIASAIVVVEATVFIVLAALGLAAISPQRLAVGVGTSSFLLVYGLGLLVAVWQLQKLNAWARGPLVFAQLVQLGLAWGLRSGDDRWVAALLVASSVVVLYFLLARSTTQTLLDRDEGMPE